MDQDQYEKCVSLYAGEIWCRFKILPQNLSGNVKI